MNKTTEETAKRVKSAPVKKALTPREKWEVLPCIKVSSQHDVAYFHAFSQNHSLLSLAWLVGCGADLCKLNFQRSFAN